MAPGKSEECKKLAQGTKTKRTVFLFIRLLLKIRGIEEFERRLGAAAEYCSVCRKIGAFEILEKRMANHICFIPIERGRIVGTRKIYSGCNTESVRFVGRFASLRRAAGSSLESLIQATFPNIREEYREQLAIADSIATGEIDPKVRQRLLRETFGWPNRIFGVATDIKAGGFSRWRCGHCGPRKRRFAPVSNRIAARRAGWERNSRRKK